MQPGLTLEISFKRTNNSSQTQLLDKLLLGHGYITDSSQKICNLWNALHFLPSYLIWNQDVDPRRPLSVYTTDLLWGNII